MKFTAEQEQVINIRGKNILVSAGAGAGKTATMIERILGLIVRDKVKVSELLVVTFTDAAAAEMKRRLTKALKGAIETETEDQPLAFLQEQLAFIASAHISTFHSFAFSVYKENYQILEENPRFKVIDEFRAGYLRAQAMEELFERRFALEEGEEYERWTDFLRAFCPIKNEDPAKAMIREVYDFIIRLPDSFKWLLSHVEEMEALGEKLSSYDSGALDALDEDSLALCARDLLIEKLHLGIRAVREVGEGLEDNGLLQLATKNQADLDGLESCLENLSKSSKFLEISAAIEALLSFEWTRFSAKKDEKEAWEPVKAGINATRNYAKKQVGSKDNWLFSLPLLLLLREQAATAKHMRTLYELVCDFADLYEGYKLEEEGVDFDDFEHFALRILEDESVCEAYRKQFSYIFVDEYQDSNYIQERFIERVSRADNVFAVGDVKQSIYSFRGAIPELFEKRYIRYEDGGAGQVINLNANFRSRPHVLDAVNGIFQNIMTKDRSGLSYDENASLKAGRGIEEGANTRLLLVADSQIQSQLEDEDKGNGAEIETDIFEGTKLQLEAIAIASKVKELYGKTYTNDLTGEVLTYRYSDMAVLLRSFQSPSRVICDALMRQGIPAVGEDGDNIFDSLEIRIFLDIIEAITGIYDDYVLVSCLTSPLFGWTVADLIELRIEHRDGSFHRAFLDLSEEDLDIGRRCKEVLGALAELRTKASFMGLGDFLWELCETSGYYDYLGTLPKGELRQENIRALIAIAQEHKSVNTLRAFVAYIKAIDSGKLTRSQVGTFNAQDDAVKLVSVHKSKGLEYPVVFLAGLNKSLTGRGRHSLVKLDASLGLALGYVSEDGEVRRAGLLQKLMEHEALKRSYNEELRILYVAMTRAREELFIVGGSQAIADKAIDLRLAKTYIDLILPFLRQARIKTEIIASPQDTMAIFSNNFQPSKVEESTNAYEFIENLLADETIDPKISSTFANRFSYVYPFDEITKRPVKYFVSSLVADGYGATPKGLERVKDSVPTGKNLHIIEDFYSDDEADAASIFEDDDQLRNNNPARDLAISQGNAFHKLMWHMDFSTARENLDRPDYIDHIISDLVSKEIFLEDEAKLINIEEVRRWLNSSLCERACKSDLLYKEAPFVLELPFGVENCLLQGVIDAYFYEGEEIVLFDYKTNNELKDEGHMRDLYTAQLGFYKKALEDITGRKVKESIIYMTKTGREIGV